MRLPVFTIARRLLAPHLLLVASLMSVAGLIGCSSANGPTPAPNAALADSQYIIGPGDNLNINVYQVPDLSLSLPVRPDGRISMPLINDLQAAGKTSTKLAEDIQGQLKDYVKDAHVTVIVTGFVGPFDRQVKVIGEATQPLALPYRDHMTLLDVMIEAKGLTRFAAGNSAEIVRQTNGKTETIKVRLGDLIRDGDVTKNIAMQPGDTLIIPQTWF